MSYRRNKVKFQKDIYNQIANNSFRFLIFLWKIISNIKQLDKDLADIQGEIRGTAANDSTTAGTDMEDGSVFAGTTKDGKLIYALPKDLGFTATFNDTAKAIKKLNEKKALGHDDWQIPDFDVLKILKRNQNQGSLKGTFTTEAASGSDYSNWYWSSPQDPDDSSSVFIIRFSDGLELWNHKDHYRLSCRPVRIVDPMTAPKVC